jgi:hypothetical protein
MTRSIIKINSWLTSVSAWIETAVDPRPLAWFRAWFGFLCLLNLALLWPDMPMWFGNEGVLPPEVHSTLIYGTRLNVYMLTGYSDQAIPLIRGIGVVGGLSLLFGYFPRIGAMLSWLALSSFSWRNMNILHSGDALLRIGCFFLIFADSSAAFSVNSFIRKSARHTTRLIPAWPQRILQLQLCVTYLVAGIWKLTGQPWQDGTAVGTVLQLGEFQRFPIPDILMTPLISELMTYHALIVELGFPFLIWIPKLRLPTLIVGLLLHMGLEWTLNIQMFQWTITAYYLLFLLPPTSREPSNSLQSLATYARLNTNDVKFTRN